MRVLVAPDSFKGSLTAVEAADAMAAGVLDAVPGADVRKLPIADGGEGTVVTMVVATGGRVRDTMVDGPLGGPVRATWGILGDGTTAVVEMAAASGLTLIGEQARNPRRTSTYGTGQLILAALDAGVRRIVIGIGGSATNDAGAGMGEALGVRFLDNEGRPLKRGGEDLRRLVRIDHSGIDGRLKETEILVACDVENILCGPRGATTVYGPQKGASRRDIEILEEALFRFGEVVRQDLGIDVFDLRGGGAAGGLGAGLAAFCRGRLQSGTAVVLDTVGFEDRLNDTEVVVTGEGRIDGHLKYGKALAGIVERCTRHSVPVLAIAGSVEGPIEQFIGRNLFASVASIMDEKTSRESAMKRAGDLLRRKTAETVSEWVRRDRGS